LQSFASKAHFLEMESFSIVVNNRNYGCFLRDAIDSALSQTYERCEVIVVDDGSTDDSCQIVESYGGRVKAIYKPSGGQASALNAGFRASTGEIVVFLDSDDALAASAVAALRSGWRRDIARIQFPLEVIDAAGKPLGRYVGGAAAIPKPALGPFGVGSPTSGNAFARHALEKVMPIPEDDWKICADAVLTAASALFGEVVSLNRPLGKYRVHGKNRIAGAHEGLAEVRRAIESDVNLHRFLRQLAPDQIGSFEQWLSRYPQHWVGRISSLRESPADHPWDDDLFELMGKAVSATWRQPYWNPRRKLAYSAWVVGYSISPKRIAQTLKRIEGLGREGLPGFLLGR
jgi:hypothetical protein